MLAHSLFACTYIYVARLLRCTRRHTARQWPRRRTKGTFAKLKQHPGFKMCTQCEAFHHSARRLLYVASCEHHCHCWLGWRLLYTHIKSFVRRTCGDARQCIPPLASYTINVCASRLTLPLYGWVGWLETTNNCPQPHMKRPPYVSHILLQ